MSDSPDTVITTPAPSATATTLVGFFSNTRSRRIRRVVGAYLMAQTTYTWSKNFIEKRKKEQIFSIAVEENDDVYWDVHEWVLKQIPESQRHALLARTYTGTASDEDDDSVGISPGEDVDSSRTTGTKARVRLFYDGSRTQKVELEGEPIVVTVEKPDSKPTDNPMSWRMTPERIVFTAENLEGRDAVLRFLHSVAIAQVSQKQRKPRLFTANPWGGWNRVSDVPVRPIEAVILQDARKEVLLADLTKFLADESRYTQLGIPYHRGYLLYGPPGTGKTSISQALAGQLVLDVYYISLSSVRSDDRLTELFSHLKSRSVLIIEDIDIVHAVRERDDEGEHVTLAGLLTALDGFITPHGLITIMTTNNRSVLDPALTRAGRVDWEEEITFLNQDQLNRMLEVFLPEVKSTVKLTRNNLTPAEVVGVIKQQEDAKIAFSMIKVLAKG